MSKDNLIRSQFNKDITHRKIIHINYGVACRIGSKIFINKKLKKYPNLYYALIKHEKLHTSGFKLKDIKIDLNGSELKGVKKDYYKFILTHPRSLVHFLPVWRYGGKLTIDLMMSFIWLLGIIIGGIIMAC